MVTKEQASSRDHFHSNGCKRTVGPRGGETVRVILWRRNGATKTWKTRPQDFRVPVKTGFYGPYEWLTHENAEYFHTAEDCPLIERA